MSAGSNPTTFEPLPIKKRTLAGIDAGQYCVRSASGELREIKAETAYEAFIKSGLKDAIKIERLSNINLEVLEKSKLTEMRDVAAEEESLHDRMLHRRIISAEELDELLRSAKEEESESAKLPLPQAAHAPEAVSVPLPERPDAAASLHAQPGATGLDVHGDGFDEIIPAAPAPKPLAAKSQEAAPVKPALPPEMATQPASDLPPEKELSAEEVEKLLGGKT